MTILLHTFRASPRTYLIRLYAANLHATKHISTKSILAHNNSIALNMSIPKTQKAAYANAVSESVEGIIYGDVESPQISGPEDIIIKNKYAGINFIESYFRKGLYPATFPYIFGREAAGVVAAIGDNVTKYKVGDKVAYLSASTFAQYTKAKQSDLRIKKLPDSASDDVLKFWASALVQGLTAITFVHEAYEVKKGDYILVWAAAGGVGQIITQYTSNLGAHVIAVASTDEKLALAKLLGADYLIKLSDDVAAKVKEITGGAGAIASFDGIGKDTFQTSLDALARKGTLVSYGNASGLVPPFAITTLSSKNIKVLRPTVFNYIYTPEEWEHYAALLEKSFEDKVVKLDIQTYPLSEYKEATTALEGRKTTGKLVLEIPQ